jgi:hypothetical protein
MLKKKLVHAPILIVPYFIKPFILDVDWSTKGVGAVLSQRTRRNEQLSICEQKVLICPK